MKQLKLGTRKSLLAMAQSAWVARELEKLNANIKVELVGIETRGDQVLDVSLSSMEGKEFFVAEIDDALKSGKVDITVHSMKDLSLDRPKEIVCGAIPRRENPRDVILYGPRILEKLKQDRKLKIGTSSPRRLENIPPFLKGALPTLGSAPPQFQLVDIRGNVNTRLSRVHLPDGDPKQLDAVVLAFAGLIRLWHDGEGRRELQRLLADVKWMVLPLQECPSAPAQGALAVECRSSDFESRRLLASLHHAMTESQVKLERAILAEWGGGCHQKLGASAIVAREVGSVLYIKGKRPDGSQIEEIHWAKPSSLKGPIKSWDGTAYRGQEESSDTPMQNPPAYLPTTRAFFVAHARAARHAEIPSGARVWTSGSSSWFKLASQGIWVEGSAENLGIEGLLPTLRENVLQLPDFKDWVVFTHEKGIRTWEKEMPGAKIVGTYQVAPPASYTGPISEADVVYWGSATQFDMLKDRVKSGVLHACGPGKTAARLRAAGVEVKIFPTVEEWRSWIQNTI